MNVGYNHYGENGRRGPRYPLAKPPASPSPRKRRAGAMGRFLGLKAITFTPSDSPAESPETQAINALQEFVCRINLTTRHAMSLRYFLMLTRSVDLLLREQVITSKLAVDFCADITRAFKDS